MSKELNLNGFEEEYNLFSEKGVCIENTNDFIRSLKFIGLFKMNGYLYPFLKQDNIYFSEIINLYDIDKDLRILFFEAIEEIEISIGSVIVNVMEREDDSLWYFKKENFSNSDERFEKHKKFLREKIITPKKLLQNDKYPSSFVLFSHLTLGAIVNIYRNLNIKYREKISKQFFLEEEVFQSWINGLIDIRNSCAHNDRLWNNRFKEIKKSNSSPDFTRNLIEKKLSLYIFVIRIILKKINSQIDWENRIFNILKKLPQYLYTDIGFSQNTITNNINHFFYNYMHKDFNHFISTLKNSIKTWEYFVNWEKVFHNKNELEITLNSLNYLLGKENLEKEFDILFQENPKIIKAFPILLAVREKNLEIYNVETKTSEFFDFSEKIEYSAELSKKYFTFLQKTGLQNLFQKDGVKNLVDYIYGVEVGLDSNGRKNRGGTLMETIVEKFIAEFCEKKGFEYLAQATPKAIQEKWNKTIKVDKSARSFDFAIYNSEKDELKLVETNFYNGGGSKLKAVCGEFKSLQNELREQNIDFIWITDGQGWHTAKRPLEETYNHNDFVFNLSMLEKDILDDIF